MACAEKRGNGYRLTVYDGYDSKGKQVKRHKTWTPDPDMTAKQISKELERQKVLFEEECKNGRIINRSIKFKDFTEKWFNEYANSHLRATTRSTYRQLSVRVHDAIGHLRIDQIKPSTLNRFYLSLQGKQTSSSHSVIAKAGIKDLLRKQGLTIAATAQKAALGQTTVKAILAGNTIARKTAEKLAKALDAQEKDLFVPVEAQEKPLAAKTIHHYHAFISSILDRAVKWGYISDNPCRRVDPPKLQRRMIQCLNKDEAKRFLECLQSESVEKQAIFYTLLFTGVRRGELLGLEWSDIDFRKKTITIQRASLYTQADGLFTDTTKTESSKRTIVVSDELLDVLRKHNDEQKIMKKTAGEDWVNSNRLFIEWNGAPMSPNKPYHMLQRLLKKYNLPTVSLHSLRHSNATIMIESGTDLRTTSDRLGHSQTSTTMNIYVHQIKSANERAAENISKAFSLK